MKNFKDYYLETFNKVKSYNEHPFKKSFIKAQLYYFEDEVKEDILYKIKVMKANNEFKPIEGNYALTNIQEKELSN